MKPNAPRPIPSPADNPCRPRHFKPSAAVPAVIDEPRTRAVLRGRRRLRYTGFAFAAAFSLIGLRVTDVTLIKAQESKLNHPPPPAAAIFHRADIIDRNGVVLATTLEIKSLYADTRKVPDPLLAAHQLAPILPGATEADLAEKLTSGKKFVWLHRRLTPLDARKVDMLGIPGLDFETEEKRVYPQGALAAHAVGFTDLDNKGLAGIERAFDPRLKSSAEPLQLSIDARLQAIVKEELEQAITTFSAVAACGIVLDVRSGEVLSLVSLPDFNPNDLNTAVKDAIFNRATLGVYEMGSVFKIYNTAMALDNHKVTLNTVIDATHPIPIGRFTIHDHDRLTHPATVSEIFEKSSNIGSAKMAEMAGIEAQRDFLGRLGLLQPATIEIPEIAAPLFPHPWHEINLLTVAFGHGIAVSPVQMAVATGAVVNGGILRPATLLKHADGYAPPGTRVLDLGVSEDMRKLMRLVVTDGTAKSAKMPPYLVGGKTGTADKVGPHGAYLKDQVLTSFMASFPMNDPRYVVFVILDNPKGTKATYGFRLAGWNSAPTAGRIIGRMAPLFGLRPIEETPEIHRAISIDPTGGSARIAVN